MDARNRSLLDWFTRTRTFPGDPGGRIRKRERPPCPITTATKDPDWIPLVANNGWLIVTRDAQIQHKRAEIDAVRTNGARMINLASADAATSWGQLEVFMTRWREIDALVDRPGLFIFVASRAGKLRAVDLSP